MTGPNELAKAALFRATAGTWESGEGRIIRPRLGRVFFLPERPYLPPGTLRQLVVRRGDEERIPEDRVRETLHLLRLDSLVERVGGLDVERAWGEMLSVIEQQAVIFARLLLAAPPFALIDIPMTPLRQERVSALLKLVSDRGIGYVVIGSPIGTRGDFDAILELAEDGGWTWTTA